MARLDWWIYFKILWINQVTKVLLSSFTLLFLILRPYSCCLSLACFFSYSFKYNYLLLLNSSIWMFYKNKLFLYLLRVFTYFTLSSSSGFFIKFILGRLTRYPCSSSIKKFAFLSYYLFIFNAYFLSFIRSPISFFFCYFTFSVYCLYCSIFFKDFWTSKWMFYDFLRFLSYIYLLCLFILDIKRVAFS